MFPLPRRGEFFPFWAPDAEGFVVGDVDDDVTLFRCYLEGIAYIERLSHEVAVALGAEIVGPVTTIGGGSRSQLWRQIRATVLDRPVRGVRNPEAALGAAAGSGNPEIASYLLALADPRMRSFDRLNMIYGMAFTAGTRDLTADWIFANYDKLLASGNGVFITSRLPQAVGAQCGADRAARIDAVLGPKVRAANAGLLDYQRTLEQIRNCGMLRDAKGAEITAALAAAAGK